MRNDLADITIIMDRSGSMEVRKTDAEGGVNSFIEEQKKLPGEARLTLVQFDHEYEMLYAAKPIKEVLAYALKPRGSTRLFDAIGSTVKAVGARLEAMPERDRPGLVTVVIVTDGQENDSREYAKTNQYRPETSKTLTKPGISEMITLQREVYKWQFIFLAENFDTFADAQNMGFVAASSANYSEEKTGGAIKTASSKIGGMRTKGLAAGNEAVVDYDGMTTFTASEREVLK